MPHATTPDGVKLYYEEAGSGTPILFVHEYSGDWRSWEPQMRFFARRHRCITYSFRGYPGSDVPESGSMYGQQHAVDDARHMLDHLEDRQGACRRPVAGRLRDGAFRPALSPTARCRSRWPASARAPAAKATSSSRRTPQTTAQRIRQEGMAKYAHGLTTNPTRSRFKQKDPRGFAEFVKHLSEHPDIGAANTMAGVPGQAAVALRLRGRSGRSSTCRR